MDLGLPEILVIVVLALLLFGPSKLPALGRSMGEAIRGFKKGLSDSHEDKPADRPTTSADQISYNQTTNTQTHQTERTTHKS